ncbi:hypothetical protein [Haloactinomyces albus]|uniref:Uncharacterized protein n=1 Tax=Haloactinomyces albus TaxID=1352928 RepID=A0AAE3ZFF0_9ACTN|nr:hypothetical protein [Haloactinomyces albus]MDR7303966.1 hypothetical protein [Haloactinomyces albus]
MSTGTPADTVQHRLGAVGAGAGVGFRDTLPQQPHFGLFSVVDRPSASLSFSIRSSL